MAPKIRTGNISQANSSGTINKPLLFRVLFCLGGGSGEVCGACTEQGIHSPACSLISPESTCPPQLAQMSFPPQPPTALCSWAKKKKALPPPLVIGGVCLCFQMLSSCRADSCLRQHRASGPTEPESSMHFTKYVLNV